LVRITRRELKYGTSYRVGDARLVVNGNEVPMTTWPGDIITNHVSVNLFLFTNSSI
jgi:hypothetical protein